jgi:hypothetical protein
MSAARLDLVWNSPSELDSFAVILAPVAEARSLRQIGPRHHPVRCPECDSIVYSRRHKLCGVCSQPLPEELLFSSFEAHRVEALLIDERRRHRQWLERNARPKN